MVTFTFNDSIQDGTLNFIVLAAHNVHYENMPVQYTEIFKVVKNENFQ